MSATWAQLPKALDAQLASAGSPERAAQEKRYLRSNLVHYGVGVPTTRATVITATKPLPLPTRGELFQAVEALWNLGVHECRYAAVELLRRYVDVLDVEDLVTVERLLREARTWALVDELAMRVVGILWERSPHEVLPRLDRWAEDADFWLRRAALLALLPSLRAGQGSFAHFTRYADMMLDEQEFFIRKAIGWVLRERARHQPQQVAEWVAGRLDRVSGVTLREAVKRLPRPDAEALLGAYRVGRANRPRGAAEVTSRGTRSPGPGR